MNKFVIISLFTIYFGQISCLGTFSGSPDFDGEIIKIEDAVELQLRAEDIFQNTSIIRLEIDHDRVLGDVKKIVYYDSRLYIFDRRYNIGVHVFDLEGKHIYSINSLGHGPGEIMEPLDFTINKSEKEIIVTDLIKGMLFFSLDGEFRRSLNFPFEYFDGNSILKVNHIEYLAHEKYFFERLISGQGGPSFQQGKRIFLGSFELLTDSLFNYSEENFDNNNVNFTLPYSYDGESVMYWRMFSDTIHRLNCMDWPPTIQSYYIDYGRNKMTKKFLKQPVEDRIRYLQERRSVGFDGFTDQIYDTRDFLLFSYVKDIQGDRGSKLLAYLDKAKKRLIVSNGLQVGSLGIFIPEISYRISSDRMATFISSDDLDFAKIGLESTSSSGTASQFIVLFHL